MIPFFDYRSLFDEDRVQIEETIRDVFDRGAFIMQSDVEAFESKFATFQNARHAISVANGTDALELALRVCNIGADDEVILPAHTMSATATAVLALGAVPVLADIDVEGLIDPVSVRRLITQKTKAVIPVHLNGRLCRMDELRELADKFNLFVIEDAAQGVGATRQGQFAGTIGDLATYSFYPAKLLGGPGDGGAITTNNSELAVKLSAMRNHGIENGDMIAWGENSRLDNLMAAILNIRLDRLSEHIQSRRTLASIYQEELFGVEQIILPPHPKEQDCFDSYQNYEIQANDRANLLTYLKSNSIGYNIPWGGKPLNQLNALNLEGETPVTNERFEKVLHLPLNHMVSRNDVLTICETIREFYR